MAEPTLDFETARVAARRNIRRFQARATRGLWHICAFLVVSVLAKRGFDFFPPPPADFGPLLGRPPSPGMISALLVLYAFSAIVLSLARIASSADSRDGLHHVGYTAAFYVFYHLSGALGDNFWAVFAAGATILALTAYNNWTQGQIPVREEMERLAHLERREGLRPGSGDPPPS